jgi:hypothetical protein
MSRPRARFSLIALILAAALAAGLFAAAGRAGDPLTTFELTLAPKPLVTSGNRVLAIANLSNDGKNTLNHTEITFLLPLGSFESATPDRCTAVDANGLTEVSCDVGTLRSGQATTQFVTFVAPPGAGQIDVTARAAYSEGTKENPDASHVDTKTDTDSTRLGAANARDEIGGCRIVAGTLATVAASGSGNPQSTSIDFGLSANLPCTPIAVGEQPSTTQNPGCPPGVKCTTQVSFVTLPPLPQAATVTLKFDGSLIPSGTTPKNFVLWETPETFPADPIRRVQRCPLPAGEDSCIVSIEKFGAKGIQVVLRVTGLGVGGGSGKVGDPRYRG